MLLSYPWVAELYNHVESGFEGVAADLECVFFVCEEWTKFNLFWSKFSLFSKFEYEFWRTHKELSFLICSPLLLDLLWFRGLTPSASLIFPLLRWRRCGLEVPDSSREWSRRPQVGIPNLSGFLLGFLFDAIISAIGDMLDSMNQMATWEVHQI